MVFQPTLLIIISYEALLKIKQGFLGTETKCEATCVDWTYYSIEIQLWNRYIQYIEKEWEMNMFKYKNKYEYLRQI